MLVGAQRAPTKNKGEQNQSQTPARLGKIRRKRFLRNRREFDLGNCDLGNCDLGFGAMDVTKPYKFRRFRTMDFTEPYKFIRCGAMDVTKPCKFIRFGAMDVTKPYIFIGFGAMI